MIITEKTSEFDKWFGKIKDNKAKAKILFRIQKIETDEHFGDWRSVGDGIHEMRIHYAKSYRVYFKVKGSRIVILLLSEINPLSKKTFRKRKKSGTE